MVVPYIGTPLYRATPMLLSLFKARQETAWCQLHVICYGAPWNLSGEKHTDIMKGLRNELTQIKLKGGDANIMSGGTLKTSLTEQHVAPLPKRVHTSGV